MISPHIVREGKLCDADIATLRAFALKIRHGLSCSCWEDLPFAFPSENIGTLHFAQSRVNFLSSCAPVKYDCCRASCCCFVGLFSMLQQCPYCNEDRQRPDGVPYKTFSYFPLIPQLSTLHQET